jgi:N-acetylmuramoyl-L-alanine amidase
MGFRALSSSFASVAGRFAPYAPLCVAAGFFIGFGAQARPTRELPPPRSPFYRAEQLRSTLETKPEARRKRRDYERVLDAYRAIYHGDPASPKADASIRAVGDLLAEEGRLFKLQKPLRDAVGEYEFLCREYPESRYRFAALLNEAEIYERDLADRNQAKAKFEEFLSKYPKHPLAVDARAGLRQVHAEEAAEKMIAHRAAASGQVLTPPVPGVVQPWQRAGSSGNMAISRSTSPVAAAPTFSNPKQSLNQQPAAVAGKLPEPERVVVPAPSNRDRPASITDIRYWSNSSSTRIAIDLEDQVKFQVVRVPNPDRIFFDLSDTHLISRLDGKSVAVTDAGFLKRIRSAQYSGDVARIVLDVSSSAGYSAFFLPNPWRLIIDIHDQKRGAVLEQTASVPAAPPRSLQVPAPVARSEAAPVPQHIPKPHRENELEALLAVPVTAAPPQKIPALAAPAQTVPLANRPQNYETKTPRAKPSPFVEATGDQSTTPPPAVAALDLRKPNSQTVTPQVTSSQNATGPQRASPSSASVGIGSPATGSFGTEVQGENGRADDGGVYERAPDRSARDAERSLVRTLGLKIGRIVIDAGHGGHDCGTIGPGGIQEKDITLDVALRLGKLLKQRTGADVIYTRADDTFIPLQVRTAIANKAHADLFISIHANSSSDPNARGVESYYLNFTTSPDALEVAARENAVSDNSIHELSDLVKQITLKDKIEESREFAADVQRSLYSGLEQGNPGLKDRGVKKAPFVVLIGANMPSILAEISFLTNPDDARELRQSSYRQRIADSLYQGVAKYVNGLSGVRLAENRERAGAN